MIYCSDLAVAGEGKWTEPRYETLGEWLGADPTDNRLNVINHWLKLIGERTNQVLDHQQFHQIPNQMIHRAASACYGNRTRVALVYQCFHHEPANAELIRTDLAHFHELLGNPENFPFYLFKTPVPQAYLMNMQQQQVEAGANPAEIIREALMTEIDLFHFRAADLHRVP